MDWNIQRRQNQGNSEGGACNLGPLAMTAKVHTPENLVAAGQVVHTTLAAQLQRHPQPQGTGQQRQQGPQTCPSNCSSTYNCSPPLPPVAAVPTNPTTLEAAEAPVIPAHHIHFRIPTTAVVPMTQVTLDMAEAPAILVLLVVTPVTAATPAAVTSDSKSTSCDKGTSHQQHLGRGSRV